MNVYRSHFKDINFDPETKLIEVIWSPESADLDEESYKNDLLAYRKAALENRPTYVLGDMREMRYVVSPELQDWVNEEILPAVFGMGTIERVAFVVSADLIAQLATEQIMEESTGANFNSRYFETREEAIAWLLQ
ncbi:STAS/SEC14 domain-containing protein [Hugenholtzia roseola]|uniref:STAS/SEC14 domain-containing protein n=1 Tax=Hugenholtzia roseola TaxID=1002 RepID=UPI0004028334|nr:STAS/SEC14 domain-containing protein [Hugenholtzia roseola]